MPDDLIQLKAMFYDIMVLRHPGHGNQKAHGNRFGPGQAKESLRRLKNDKGARERYKDKARGKRGTSTVARKEPKAENNPLVSDGAISKVLNSPNSVFMTFEGKTGSLLAIMTKRPSKSKIAIWGKLSDSGRDINMTIDHKKKALNDIVTQLKESSQGWKMIKNSLDDE